MRKLLFAALAVLAVGSFAIAPAFADGQGSVKSDGNGKSATAHAANGDKSQGKGKAGHGQGH